MKFGKTLAAHVDSCQKCEKANYVDYAGMKRLIKSECSETEFQQTFHRELHKVVDAMKGTAMQVDPEFASINRLALDKISKKYDKQRRNNIRQLNFKVATLTMESTLRIIPLDDATLSAIPLDLVPTDGGRAGAAVPPSTAVTFMAGGVSGVMSRCCTAPLDRIKILMQADAGKFGGKKFRKRGIHGAAKFIIKDGGVTGFWRGNLANVLKVVPESATRFVVYDLAKGQICEDPRRPKTSERLLAGCSAGAVSQTLVYPLDIVKTRLAASSMGDYRGIWHCMRHSVQREGYRAMFKGIGPALLAIMPASAVDLTLYNTLRDWYLVKMTDDYTARLELETKNALDAALDPNALDIQIPVPRSSPPIWLSLCFGAASATCGAVIAYPLTLVRTKLMTQGMRRVPVEYTNAMGCIKGVYAIGGFRGFYRGLTPALLKTVPAVSIGYAGFELAKRAAMT